MGKIRKAERLWVITDPKSKWLVLINMYPLPDANPFVHLLEFKTEPCALQPQQAKTSFKIPKHKCAIYSHVKESFLQRLTFFFPSGS